MNVGNDEKLQLLFGRRSVRVYAPGEISDGLVHQLLRAAMAAPSAMSKDPWRFVVIRRPETLVKLAGALPGGAMLRTATLGIAVCGDLEAALEQHVGYLLQDCSAAIENLLLAAHFLGLGACWVGVHPAEACTRDVRELLGLPKPILPIAVIALGRPGEQPEPRTRFNPSSVRYEHW